MKIKSKNNWQQWYKKEGYRGRYPNEDVIRFIQRYFSERRIRGKIKILEWGSGTGRHMCYLAREGFLTYGVDIAAAGVVLTNKWLKKFGLKAQVKKIDGVTTDFPDNFFDAIIDCASLQHNRLEQIEQIIAEMRRIVKPGGRIFSYCKSPKDSLYKEGKKIEANTYFLKRFVEIPMIIHFFSEREIKYLLRGFTDLEIEYTERTIRGQTRKMSHFIVSAVK